MALAWPYDSARRLSEYLRQNLANIDHVTGSAAGDVVNGSDAADLLRGGIGNDTLAGAGGSDTLFGNSGGDSLAGDDGDDLIVQDVFEGDDTIDGGAGDDTLDYSSAAGEVGIVVDLVAGTVRKFVAGAAVGTDLISSIERIVGTSRADSLTGGQLNDSFSGGSGNDTMNGGAGNDTLSGDDGNDRLVSGGGNDDIRGGNGDDLIAVIALTGNSLIDGGLGFDTLDYSQSTTDGAAVTVNLTAGTVTKTVGGVVVGTDTLRDIEDVIGSLFNDVISGTAGSDLISGGAGDDLLTGGGGRDYLYGGSGNDTINGGDGDDVIVQIEFAGNATIDGGAGRNTVDYSMGVRAGGNVSAIYNGDSNTWIVNKYDRDGILVGSDTLANIDEVAYSTSNDSAPEYLVYPPASMLTLTGISTDQVAV